MNRQTLSVFSLFLVGVFSFVGVVGSGEIQTITLHGKPLTLIGKKSQMGKKITDSASS